jgi:DNA-binding MarR family transcriptional regulator
MPTASVSELRRWSRFLDPTPIERKIIDHVLFEGRDLRWTMFTGTNMADDLACIHGNHIDLVKRGLVKLVRQGWLQRGKNDVGQRFIQLTPKFEEACALANQRALVRRALGPATWWKINGTDKIADALHELTLDMKQVRYKDRVKAAAKPFISDTGRGKSPGDESSLLRRRIVTSQVTIRHLALIDGERKSAP